jgi:hypothetical protein
MQLRISMPLVTKRLIKQRREYPRGQEIQFELAPETVNNLCREMMSINCFSWCFERMGKHINVEWANWAGHRAEMVICRYSILIQGFFLQSSGCVLYACSFQLLIIQILLRFWNVYNFISEQNAHRRILNKSNKFETEYDRLLECCAVETDFLIALMKELVSTSETSANF